MENFLDRVQVRMDKAIHKNEAHNLFSGYDIQTYDTTDETELAHKLTTKYDFAEANDATKQALKKQREAEGMQEDDFEESSEFKEYK